MIGFSEAHGLQPTRCSGKVVRFSDLYGWSFPLMAAHLYMFVLSHVKSEVRWERWTLFFSIIVFIALFGRCSDNEDAAGVYCESKCFWIFSILVDWAN